VVGIQGKLRNTKNKCSIPFKECEFELRFDEGLNSHTGLLKLMEEDGHIERNGAWYTIVSTGAKFQSKDFAEMMQDPVAEGVTPLAKFLKE